MKQFFDDIWFGFCTGMGLAFGAFVIFALIGGLLWVGQGLGLM